MKIFAPAEPRGCLTRPRHLFNVFAGRFALATSPCGYHSLAARREAPHIKRIHLAASVHKLFGFIPRLAGDP